MFIHIDCNSFYASCEVALHADLAGKPVVVANYNEAGGGVILALTKEAKALGLKRGNPVFQVKEVLEKNKVTVFPADLQKYCDISRHIMQVVREQDILLDFVQYSIDEFFGTIPEDEPNLLRPYIEKVRDAILHGTGIPVSCGASATYTLSKVATWYAKHYQGYDGICILQPDNYEKALRGLPVENIWGVGRSGRAKLWLLDIHTALDYIRHPEREIRRLFSVAGVRTWKELHGTPCIDITSQPRQSTIMHTRTFAYMTNDMQTLDTYLINYAAGAARKLRDQHKVCRTVSAFIHTNPHRPDLLQYSGKASLRLTTPTSDTIIIAKTAQSLLSQIFRAGYLYKRAGIILSDITTDEGVQLDLFNDTDGQPEKHKRLMQATDDINRRFGMDKVRMAAQGYSEDQQASKDPRISPKPHSSRGNH
jgi:DNA polymerase V